MRKMKYLENNEDKLGVFLFILGVIYLAFSSYLGLFKMGLWLDEFYSIVITQMPFEESFNIILTDVHPFLYYMILRFFAVIFEFVGFTNTAVVGKLVSLIPFYLLAIVSVTKVRKNFGWLTSGLFFLCMASMPRVMIHATDIRMYSWALFFVTLSLIYAYEITKDSSYKNWIVLTILTVASAYTHYFSAISSFSIYIVLLIYIIRKDRELFKKWIISSIFAVICYLPGIFVLLNQINKISGGYWISPISKKVVLGYIYFVLSPANDPIRANEIVAPTVMGTLFLIAFIYLLYKYNDEFTVDSILVFLIVPIIGIIVSLCYQPVFHARYLVPVLGCIWLAFSILMKKAYANKKVFLPILVLVLLVGVVGAYDFNNIHNGDIEKNNLEADYLSNLGSNNVIIMNSDYMLDVFYYSPNNHYILWNPQDNVSFDELIQDPYVVSEINNGSKVYYVDSNQTTIQMIVQSGDNLVEIPINSTILEYRIHLVNNLNEIISRTN